MNPYKTLLRTFSGCCGLIAVVVVLIFVFEYSPIFKNQCQIAFGRVCNGMTCNPDGSCDCGSLKSGDACEHSGMPGYLTATDDVCLGRAKAPPIFKKSRLPEVCQEDKPSVLNQYTNNNKGFHTPECQEILRINRQDIYDGVASAQQLRETPTCVCGVHYKGTACEEEGCPTTDSGLVCGGNGNSSVGFLRNGTDAGVGCQCGNVVHLTDFLGLLTRENAQALQESGDIEFYAKGICGEVYVDEQDPSIVLIIQSTKSSYRCFCKLRATGPICLDNVCPTYGGLTCATNGFQGSGFGYERNTTRNVTVFGEKCDPICLGGTELCDNKECTLSKDRYCRRKTSPLRCPKETPYRCPDMSCVKPPTASTFRDMQYGYLETPPSPTCLLLAQNSTTDERTKCLGSEGVFYETNKFEPRGDITFTSSLRTIQFQTMPQENGVINLYYNGERIRTVLTSSTEITLVYQVLELDRDIYEGSLYSDIIGGCFLSTTDQKNFDVRPSPFRPLADNEPLSQQQVRFKNDFLPDEYFVGVTQNVRIEYGVPPSLSAWDFVVNVSDTHVLLPDRRVVTFEQCFTNLESCVWRSDTFLSLSGRRKVCFAPDGVTVISSFRLSCDTSGLPPFLPLTYVLEVQSKVPVTTNLDYSWTVQNTSFTGTPTNLFTWDNVNNVIVSNIQFVTVDDMRKASICLTDPIESNASIWNRQWEKELVRPRPSLVGDYAIGRRPTLFGDQILTRGIFRGNNLLYVEHEDKAYKVTELKHLNYIEYQKGIYECEQEVWETRCPDGQCAQLQATLVTDIVHQCTCKTTYPATTTCSCLDENEETHLCTCSSSKCTCSVGDKQFDFNLFDSVDDFLGTSYCMYFPTERSVVPEVTTEGNTSTIHLDNTIVLWFEYSSCVVYNTSIPIDFTCNSNNSTGKARIKYNFQRDGVPSLFEITGNGTISNVVSTFKNAAPLYAETVSVSSNSADAQNVVWNNDTAWLSTTSDHDAFVQFSYSSLKHFTLLLVEFSKLGIEAAESYFIPVRAIVQVSNTSEDNTWVDYAQVTGTTFNGSQVEEIELNAWGKHIRVYAKAPIGVRVFLPFSDQDCFKNGTAVENIQLFVSKEQEFSSSAISSVLARGAPTEGCICEDTCILGGFDASKNGICQDLLYRTWNPVYERQVLAIKILDPGDLLREYFNLSSSFPLNASVSVNLTTAFWSSNVTDYNVSAPVADLMSFFRRLFVESSSSSLVNLTGDTSKHNISLVEPFLSFYQEVFIPENIQAGIHYCYSGRDCTDCGFSNRNSQIDKGSSCEQSDQDKFILAVFGNTSIDTGHLFVLRELIQPLSFAIFQVNVTQEEKVVFTPKCVKVHPVVTCPDGSHALTKQRCPQTRYNCHGDGCTQLPDNLEKRVCACKAGFGGRDCSYDVCVPATPGSLTDKARMADPAKWCTCQRRHGGRLVIRPPFSYDSKFTILTKEQLITINQRERLKNDYEIDHVNIGWTDAPFGRPVVYLESIGNQTFLSNCMPVVKDRRGIYRTMAECQEWSTDLPSRPIGWLTLYEFNGQPYIIPWPHIFYYNDLSYPCSQGSCVETPSQCYQEEINRPLCNNNGVCHVDGSCVCEKGKETFVINDDITVRAKYPYYVANPTIWGYRDHRQYSDLTCTARDCSVVDCTRRKACFPGSIQNNFKDKLFTCPESTSFGGLCAPDLLSCKAGSELSEPQDCGANGYLIREENRPFSYKCKCGLPPFQLQVGTVIKDSTNLLPNGFGGPLCTEHKCTERTDKIYFERINPQTGTYYLDENGDTLPGVWFGPCRSRAGFSIDDIGIVNSCCDKYDRFEHCPYVPCVINGITKCVEVGQCQGYERRPKVYACNGKGDALADGTCLCNYDPLTGTGYTADHEHYSFEGCFKLVRCPISPRTQTVCGRQKANEGMRRWARWPEKQYMEQQYLAFLGAEGLPPTDKSAVNKIYRTAAKKDAAIFAAAIARAEYGLGEMAAIQSCVAVGPNDTTTSYCCMVDNKVPPPTYGEGFNRPYILNNFTLSDERARFLFETYRFVETFQLRYRAGQIRVPLQVTFTGEQKFVDVVRIRATYNQTTPSFANFRITLQDGSTYTSDLIPSSSNLYEWIEIKLLDKWQDIDLSTLSQWVIKCKSDPTALFCLSWYDPTCEQEGGTVQLPGSFVLKNGCNSRCCKLIQTASQLSSFAWIEVDPLTVGVDVNVFVQAIQIFGHETSRLQPLPENFASELEFRTGTRTCLDELFANHRDTKLCGQNSYFLGRTFPAATVVQNLNFEQAKAQCLSSGSSLAVTLGGEQLSDYARTMGAACYGDRSASGSVCDDLPITGVDNGCLVGAMEVTTPLQPAEDYFFEPSCLVNGCYTVTVGIATENGQTPLFAYSPSENHGTSWTTPSPTLPRQPPWNHVISEWFRKEKQTASYKANNYVLTHCFNEFNYRSYFTLGCPWLYKDESLTCLLHDITYDNSYIIANPTLTQLNFYYTEEKVPGSDRDGLATFSLSQENENAYSNLREGTTDSIPTKFVQNTNSAVCQVIVWDQVLCGVHTHGTRLNPRHFGIIDRSIAARRVFIVEPATYAEFLHLDLGAYRFNECEDGSTDCAGYDQPIQGFGWSFSVNGPCDVELTDVDGVTFIGDNGYPLTTIKVRRGARAHVKLPISAYLSLNQCESPTGGFPDGRPRTFWHGNCFSNFQAELLGPSQTRVHGFGCYWLSPSCGYPLWEDERLFGIIRTFKIRPKFTSRRIEIRLYTETKPHGDGAGDEYTMGHQVHQYMCGRVNAVQTYRVTPTTADGNTYTIINRITAGNLVIQDFSNLFFTEGGDGNIISPFVACPRLVRQCFHDCFKTRPPSTFQFRPEIYQEPDFVQEVSVMRQQSLGSTPAVVPDIHVNWQRAGTGQVIMFHKLLDMNNATYFRAGSRLISKFKSSEYPTKYFLDLCVVVIANPPGSSVPYRFDTALCNRNGYAAMCIRDTIKYTAKSGTLYDVCGASCRSKAYDPFATPYTLHPDGLRINNEKLHELIDAYLDGTLINKITTTELDYKQLMKEIRAKVKGKQALAPAYPVARKFWNNEESQRPGHVSRGQVADPVYSIDMEFKRWYPVDCGRVYSLDTLIGTVRASEATEFCKYETQVAAGGYKGQLPAFLLGVSPTRDLTRETACGTLINPAYFDTYYQGSPPWIDSSRVRVLQKNGRRVTLEMLAINATWRNTGQRQDYVYEPQKEFIVTGDIDCETCTVQLWLSTFSVSASTPAYKYVIGSVTGTNYYSFAVNHNVTDYVLMILGWDISGTLVGDIVELSPALITNNQSRFDCTLPIDHDDWVDVDSTSDSAAFDHQCVTSLQQARQLGVDEVGVCSCEKPQPFLGATCDEPATFSLHGKRVCNGAGDNQGNAFDMEGNIVPLTLHDGLVLEKDGEYRCAKFKNVGMTLQTTLQGDQPYDYRKVTITSTPEFEERYVVVDVPETQYPQLEFDFKTEGSLVCASFSYTLVSFQTLSELIDLKQTATLPAQTDLTFTGDGVLLFEQRGQPLRSTANVTDNVLPQLTPCVGRQAMCDALHFNDLMYNYTASSSLVNGGNTSVCLTGGGVTYTYNFSSTATVTFPITIELRHDGGIDLSAFIVITYSDVAQFPCGAYASLTSTVATWTCSGTSGGVYPTTIRFTTGVTSPCLRGVTAFNGVDMRRVPGLYEY